MSWKERYLCRFRASGSGSILIVALWSLFFLSGLAMAVAAYVRPQIELARRLKDRVGVYYLAQSGVKKSITEITRNASPKYDTLKEFLPSGKNDLTKAAMSEGEFYYTLADEERKININKASYDVLERFFETAAGLSPLQAGEIAVCIMDWREKGDQARKNGAKSGYYQTLNPAYPCKNNDFELLEEILMVKRMTPAIFNMIKNRITVYGNGAVNINTADELVLESLGVKGNLAGKIVVFRNGNDGIEGTDDDNVFLSVDNITNDLRASQNLTQDESSQLADIVASGLLCVRSDNFRGESVGRNTRDSVRIDFVFNRDKAIKFWRQG